MVLARENRPQAIHGRPRESGDGPLATPRSRRFAMKAPPVRRLTYTANRMTRQALDAPRDRGWTSERPDLRGESSGKNIKETRSPKDRRTR